MIVNRGPFAEISKLAKEWRPDLARAARATAGIIIPLLLAETGHIPLHVIFAAIAAQNVAMADVRGSYSLGQPSLRGASAGHSWPNRRAGTQIKSAVRDTIDRASERGAFSLELLDLHTWRLGSLQAALSLSPSIDRSLIRYMLRLVARLAPRLTRTRHSYYRAMRLVHEHFGADPATLGEDHFRDYLLHVKTRKGWKPKTIRQTAACARLFFVEMLGCAQWKLFS